MQRLPKLRGFKSHRTKPENVFTDDLSALSGVIDNQAVADAGLVSNAFVTVKVLKRGDVSKKLSIKLQSISVTALEAVEAAGGSFEKTDRQSRPKSAKKSADAEAK